MEIEIIVQPLEELYLIMANDIETGKNLGQMECYVHRNTIGIPCLAVEKSHRHKGIGTLMYQYLERHAKGSTKIVAHSVINTNEASVGLHKKMGFIDTETSEERKSRKEYSSNYVKETDPNIAKLSLAESQSERHVL